MTVEAARHAVAGIPIARSEQERLGITRGLGPGRMNSPMASPRNDIQRCYAGHNSDVL